MYTRALCVTCMLLLYKLKIMVACIWHACSDKGGIMAISYANITYSTIRTAAVMPQSLLHSIKYTVHQLWGGDSVLTTSTALLRQFVQP